MGPEGAAMVRSPWGRGDGLLLVVLQAGELLFLLEVDGVGDSSEAEE